MDETPAGITQGYDCTTREHQRDRTVLRRLSGTEIKELVAGYLRGASVYELGVRHGIHWTTVSGHLQRAGVHVRGRSMSDAEVEHARRLYADGLSLARIGEQLGFDGETIRLALRARGVRLRDPHGRERNLDTRSPQS